MYVVVDVVVVCVPPPPTMCVGVCINVCAYVCGVCVARVSAAIADGNDAHGQALSILGRARGVATSDRLRSDLSGVFAAFTKVVNHCDTGARARPPVDGGTVKSATGTHPSHRDSVDEDGDDETEATRRVCVCVTVCVSGGCMYECGCVCVYVSRVCVCVSLVG